MSIWGTTTFPFTNAVKIFLDKNPNIFLLDKKSTLFYAEASSKDSKETTLLHFLDYYVENYYTNITTKYEEYGFYLYMLK